MNSHSINDADVDAASNVIKGSAHAAFSSSLGKILTATQAAIDGFATSYEEDVAEVVKGFVDYDSWVALQVKTRYKLLLNKAVEQLEWRMAHANDENHVGSWKTDKDANYHLLVHNIDYIVEDRDSLFVVKVQL